MAQRGIRILETGKKSAARNIGLMPGDSILTVNGHEIEDELALKFFLSEGHTDMRVRRASGVEEYIRVDLSEETDLGITVEEFRTLTCSNACLFCFVDQLPSGVRQSLRVKDDDYRLSFLHGNYITLTNISAKEMARIVEQRLSPLYVSVHATDTRLRARIMGRRKQDDLMGKLNVLVQGGVRIHAQIVLMPGINDGENLKKTVYDLYRLYPGVQSVAIVPVGLSEHGKPKDNLIPVTPGYCRRLIRKVIPWQKEFRTRIGCTFACLADEFYIQGGADLPPWNYYDDFSQIEDGVGMARSFIDEFDMELKRRRKSRSALSGTLVTGRLFAPILRRCIHRFNKKFGSRLKVRDVENRFLGGRITVAGLLSGQDILTALSRKEIGNFLIVPNEAFSGADRITLDGLSVKDLSAHLGRPVFAGGRTMRDFFALLFSL